jgi:large subunit ribosomal protein L4
MKVNVIDLSGKKSAASVSLPENIFGVKVSPVVLAQYIRVYLSRQRSSRAQAKTRGQVAGTTAKMWRQKGTGRARHGSRKAPIFVGGGKAHGPTGLENYNLRVSKKVRRLALLGALTSKVNDVRVVTSLDSVATKTNTLSKSLKSLITSKTPRLTLVLPDTKQNIIKASRNLDFITTTQASRLNAYEVLNSPLLVFTEDSLTKLTNTLNPASIKPTQDKTPKTPKSTTKLAPKVAKTKTTKSIKE